ncbi:hypothetical protein A2837_01875 [Candidatus Kaiserbacteria bacterium RIFCSPHIGHO2_01_FULL_46_22]|uniref:FAD-dependent oxidoreductase n=1 Tax=Candidatus Kaiserbacteria bacterium RIFCSPHIGHO2_01_FULL_46_22 TaxID=1798475 RepID=A0A1F6BYA5_9BACT|nr:MAG: hypothetical protein A2837_01875 [Candidatus Kaiserbacteria bacterium RIFCSPHIGHO2_01_FULL_46_22]
MSSIPHYDVIVIGGGPSGMMAAGKAALRGRRVLLIEKNKDLGKKLSITGGGRCNILNAEEDERELLSHYGEASKFLHSPFSQHGMKDSWRFFEELGLPIVVEARKRAFPESQKAADVTAALRKYVTTNNVELKRSTRASGFIMKDGQISGVKTNNGTYSADSYVLATGGLSHQETGSTGEGLEWLKQLGYRIHEPNPNIVPLTVDDEWVKKLSGTSLSFMKITFGSSLSKKDGKFSRTGKILFTHFGLSGPLILNSAHSVKKLLDKHGTVEAKIDMYPDTETGVLQQRVLSAFERNKNKLVKNVLNEIAPEGMDKGLIEILPTEFLEEKVHSVNKAERQTLVDLLKAMPVTVDGTMGMDWAVISDGGIDLTQVDTKTMRSKLHPNLFFTGDVLNINRPSGGYSLQLCWTTGTVVGMNA